MSRRRGRQRGAGVAAVAGVALAWAVVRLLPDEAVGAARAARPSGADLDTVLGATAALAGLGCLGYLALILVLAGLAGLPSALGRAAASTAATLTPALIQRVLCASLGTGLALAGASEASAAPSPAAPTRATATQAALPAIPLDRPAAASGLGSAPAGPGPGRPTTADSDPSRSTAAGAGPNHHMAASTTVPVLVTPSHGTVVVVRPGDSLWRIAARAMGAEASAAEIAREWPRWYAANRTAIGPEPALIRPGQRLVPPPSPPGPVAIDPSAPTAASEEHR